MTLCDYLKTKAPGWTVRGLAGWLGYTEDGLRKKWRQKPEHVLLWIDGLRYRQENNNVQDD